LAIQDAEEFWLKTSESLRKLDLAIDLARRQQEVQIPLREAQDIITFLSEWTRISLMQLLSSEGTTLAAGFPSIGAFKSFFVARFKDVLSFTFKSSLKTNSPAVPWAAEIVKEVWNVSE
jgi:hypothetical protein